MTRDILLPLDAYLNKVVFATPLWIPPQLRQTFALNMRHFSAIVNWLPSGSPPVHPDSEDIQQSPNPLLEESPFRDRIGTNYVPNDDD